MTQVLNRYSDIYIKPVFTDALGISVLSCIPTHACTVLELETIL